MPGGETWHDSMYCGILAIREYAAADDIVRIHGGAHPLIEEKLITDNIEPVREYGNAITCEADRESRQVFVL